MHRAILHDKRDYEDPLIFRPERFLTPNGSQLDPTVREPNAAFGFGRRCVSYLPLSTPCGRLKVYPIAGSALDATWLPPCSTSPLPRFYLCSRSQRRGTKTEILSLRVESTFRGWPHILRRSSVPLNREVPRQRGSLWHCSNNSPEIWECACSKFSALSPKD
jgi:hypothetical protein